MPARNSPDMSNTYVIERGHYERKPFGEQGQDYETISDRIGVSLRHNFSTNIQIKKLGTFVSNPANKKTKLHEKTLKRFFDVADKEGARSQLYHVKFERSLVRSGETVILPRGGMAVASRATLCKFIAEVVQDRVEIPKFDMTKSGMYWEMFHPQRTFPHPYIDIDFAKVPTGVTFNDVYVYVHKVVTKMTEMIQTLSEEEYENVEVVIFFNKRRVHEDYDKYSFHLHWPEYVAPSMSSLSAMVHSLNEQLEKKPVWVDDIPSSGHEPLTDTKPYGANKQLFRLPFCGKFGDDSTMLLPIRVFQDVNTGIWDFVPNRLEDVESWIDKSCIFTVFENKYRMLRTMSPQGTREVRLPTDGVIAVGGDRYNRKQWLDFWDPVLRSFVIPNFVRHRQEMMTDLGVPAVSSPDPDKLQLGSFDRLLHYPASYRIQIYGDNFCEFDNGGTPHTHSNGSNCVSYLVDLSKGLIAQQCFRCQPANIKWYPFIEDGRLTFPVMSEERAKREGSENVTVVKSFDTIPFFLQYWHKNILYCLEKKQVLVYNEENGIWIDGHSGNRILLQFVAETNNAYRRYQVARHSKITDEQMAKWDRANPRATEEERETTESTLNSTCKEMNKKIPNLLNLTLSQQKDFISILRSYVHPHNRERMEPFGHLVPLKERKCVDVYTWKVLDIRPDFFFTSHHNASLIDIRDTSINEFVKWQEQVCCGDKEYVTYKLRIFGLSFTMLNFDRAFYMPLGPVGKNGKSSEASLLNDITASTTPNRGYNMTREYLTKTSQDKKGANAPDTVLIEMSNKCLVIADECRDTQLDGALIKSFVSGDKANARNLYESERTSFDFFFTLFIIANKQLRIDYMDKALMSRLRILPYNAQWVADPVGVKAQMEFPASLYVFQEDPYFKNRQLKTWGDAMLTKCLYELHLFLKALPRDPENCDRPAKLTSIPVPKVVRAYTDDIICRGHPVLGFIKNHITKCNPGDESVTVEEGFNQFRQYARNENNSSIKKMDRAAFQEAMMKEMIDIILDEHGRPCLSNHKISREVPCYDAKVDVPATSYVPPTLKRTGTQAGFSTSSSSSDY